MSRSDLPEGFEPTTPTGLPNINKPTDGSLPDGFEPSAPPPSSNDVLTPRGKSIVHAVTDPLLKYGGAAVGATLASPEALAATVGTGGLAIPAAGALEMAAGAGGYAAGASLSDQLDQLIGYAPPPSSISDVAKRTGTNIKEGFENEAGARIIGAGINATGAGVKTGLQKAFVGATSPENIQRVSDLAKKVGVDLTPAEIAGSKMLNAVEKIFDNLPWTQNTVNEFRLQQLKQLNEKRAQLIAANGNGDDIEQLGLDIKSATDKFIQKVGITSKSAMTAMKDRLLQKVGSNSTYDDLDISAKQAVQQYQQDLSKQTSAAYTKVNELAPQDKIVPDATLNAAQQIIKEQERVAPAARNKALYNTARALTQTSDSVPEEVRQMYASATPVNKAALEDQFPELLNPAIEKSYQDLSANVSAFNAKKYAQVDTSHGAYSISNEGRQWDNLIKGLHEDMENIVSKSENEDLIQANKVAKQLYLKKLALFQDPAFKAINDKYPGAIAKSVLQSGSNDLIQRYRALTGESLFSKAKDRLTNDVIGLNENDIVQGDDIRKNLLKLGDTINTIYNPQELQYFKKLADAVDLRKGATNDILNNPLVKKMATNGVIPSGVAKAIVTPENPGASAAVERIMGPKVKKQIADAFLPHLLSTNQNGDFLPSTFAKEFNKYGYKTIESWYGKDTATELQNLSKVAERMKGAEAVATGAAAQPNWKYLLGIYGVERLGSMALNTVTNPTMHAVLHLGQDGAVILGTRQLAKLYASSEGKSLFLHGLITSKMSKDVPVITARILSAIGQTKLKQAQGE